MEAFPFQSNFTGYDDAGNPKYDRAVGASFIHAKDKLYYSNGIFPNPSDNFQVLATDTMAVHIQPGTCFIEGVTGIEDNVTVLTIEQAEELTARTDTVVLRLDFVNRWIEVAVKKGTTELTRNGNVWELRLAEITVPKMVQSIAQSHITDTRLSADCGIVDCAVRSVDTATIFAEYTAKWEEVKATMAANETAYNAWYDTFTNTAETLFNARIADFDAWFAEKKAQIFDAKYFDFDNLAYRADYTYSYSKTDNVYTETIAQTQSGEVYATRISTKVSSTQWTIHTVCTIQGIDITETWTKADEIWKGEIS